MRTTEVDGDRIEVLSMTRKERWSFMSAGGGALAVIVALLLNISRDSSVALSVAEQHGIELNGIRQRIAVLDSTIRAATLDKYTKTEAREDLTEIRRRLEKLESKHEK